MLMGWMRQPHVQRWWDRTEPYTREELADPRVNRFILEHVGRPFAFMQDYAVHGWDAHHFADLPQGSRGIDQLIGDPKMLGHGHGAAFIAQHMGHLFAQGAPVIAADPHPDNERAIAVYRKLGFAPDGPPRSTQWGQILPMIAKRPS